MRLITHTDLDGIMCAALLSDVEEVLEIKFADPGSIQAGKIFVNEFDIIADLPYDRRCGMWFDHHESSRPREGMKFEGAWKLAPSAARVVYDYYENPYLEKYAAALVEVDKIDSGQVELSQVKNPSGWFLLSNTLESSAPKKEDDEYRRHVIALIRKTPDAEKILADEKVAKRVAHVREDFALFEKLVRENTVIEGKVAYSDLRGKSDLPRGNNYLVYALFPQAISSVRIMPLSENEDKDTVKISVGHNIYGKKCGYDVGAAMKKIGGGGHKPVGGASVKKDDAEAIAKRLVKEINDFEAAEESKGAQ
ncbi:MAG: hypothetical protein WCT52_02610 [Candidatus Micrarchaeia archaeon]